MKNFLRKFHGEQSLTSLESQLSGTLTIRSRNREYIFLHKKAITIFKKLKGEGEEIPLT